MSVYLLCTILKYLSMRALLQRGLHHDVALHAHLELRDVCGDPAFSRGPQSPQELASPDSVHDHSPILIHSEQQ